jgi:hypothetical protein
MAKLRIFSGDVFIYSILFINFFVDIRNIECPGSSPISLNRRLDMLYGLCQYINTRPLWSPKSKSLAAANTKKRRLKKKSIFVNRRHSGFYDNKFISLERPHGHPA